MRGAHALPRGVMVTQETLNLSFKVRVLARQPLRFTRRKDSGGPLAFNLHKGTLRALMEKNSNKAVLTDLQALDIESLKERLSALRRFL